MTGVPLVIFGNRPRRRTRANPRPLTRRTCMSRHVQAIAYIHARDGKPYVHGFGDAALNERDLNRGWLNLSDLKTRTDVAMEYDPETETITIRGTRGQSLAALFED